MTEEQKRIRYRNIVYRLWIINNKIEQLNNSISSLKQTTKNSILINEQVLEEEKLNDINNDLVNISYSIRGNIIPSLNYKIYN